MIGQAKQSYLLKIIICFSIIVLFSNGTSTISAQGNPTVTGVIETQPLEHSFVDSIDIEGWVVDTEAGIGNGPGVQTVVAMQGHDCNGQILGETLLTEERPDVITAMGIDETYLQSGFRLHVDLTTQPFHRITITFCAESTIRDKLLPITTQQYSTSPSDSNIFFLSFVVIVLVFPVIGILQFIKYRMARTPETKRGYQFWYISVAISMIPVLYILFTISQFGVNIPYYDDWDILVRPYLTYQQGGLDFDFLRSSFQLHSAGHRIAIPILAGTLFADITSLNMLAYMAMNVAVGVVIVILTGDIIKSCVNIDSGYILMIFVACLVFSPAIDFWVDARFFSYLLGLLGLVGSIWAICVLKISPTAIGLAAIMSYIGSLSFFSGNFSWILLYPLLWLYGYRKYWYYALWTLMTLSVLLPFVVAYPSVSSSDGIGLPSIDDAVRGLLIFAGMPFNRQPNDAVLQAPYYYLPGLIGYGLLTLVITIHLMLHRKKLIVIFPVLLYVGWSILNGLAAVFGRLPRFGILVMGSFRYEIYGAILWVGIFGLLYVTYDNLRKLSPSNNKYTIIKNVSIGTMGAIMGFSVIATSMTHIHTLTSSVKSDAIWCLLNEVYDRDCLRRMHPRSQELPLLAYQLKQYQTTQFTVDEFTLHPDFMSTTTEAIQSTDVRVQDMNGTLFATLINSDIEFYEWQVFINDEFPSTFGTGLYNDSANPVTVTYIVTVESEMNATMVQKYSDTLNIPSSQVIMLDIELTPFKGQLIEINLAIPENDDIRWIMPRIRYEL